LSDKDTPGLLVYGFDEEREKENGIEQKGTKGKEEVGGRGQAGDRRSRRRWIHFLE
jgi:hypothetical protein